MAKGAKYIIVILAAVLLIGAVFIVFNNFKEALVKEYAEKENALKQKADSLTQQLSQSNDDKRRIQEKLSVIQKEIDGITTERDNWKRKYDVIAKEKEELITKLQALPKVVEKPKEVVGAPPTDEYWAGVLKEKANLELRIGNLKDDLSETRLQIEELKKVKTELELEISKLESTNIELERKIKNGSDLADKLSLDLAREKSDKRYVNERLNAIKEENQALRSQIKELATTKVSLGKALKKLIEQKESLSQQLLETETVIRERLEDIAEIKNELSKRLTGDNTSINESKTIELPPIVVRAQGASTEQALSGVPSSTHLRGSIISINEANNFVIIDLGENAGVRLGDTFRVFRDSKLIANIEVIQVRKDISAADIKEKTQSIQVGDTVR